MLLGVVQYGGGSELCSISADDRVYKPTLVATVPHCHRSVLAKKTPEDHLLIPVSWTRRWPPSRHAGYPSSLSPAAWRCF
ncbi:hypothetical protein NDU88_002756 [Pleurodeles waltl]|uniref:Uncharacterized protein n=1 Tax=Pleurodeles waltl TaxID=8319 RepID=A0AAV7QAT0_PLEWA|nr:hypothetical protein NDU88_002756 [Pleurodeles waltl]